MLSAFLLASSPPSTFYYSSVTMCDVRLSAAATVSMNAIVVDLNENFIDDDFSD